MSKLIDTTALSHFFERLKGVFWLKGEADEVYALKHGSNDSYFSASNFSVGSSFTTLIPYSCSTMAGLAQGS